MLGKVTQVVVYCRQERGRERTGHFCRDQRCRAGRAARTAVRAEPALPSQPRPPPARSAPLGAVPAARRRLPIGPRDAGRRLPIGPRPLATATDISCRALIGCRLPPSHSNSGARAAPQEARGRGDP